MASIELSRLSGINLLVAGESGIDEYIWGDTRRISPEAPVPVVEVSSQTLKLGLSANVAQNIVSLGGKVCLVSVRGSDPDGGHLEEMLTKAGIERSVLHVDKTRPTLRKVRVIAQRQHVVRIDYEKAHPLSPEIARRFRESICDLIPSYDGVIVQDYAKGLWNPDTISFIEHAKKNKKPVFVDPSRLSSARLYRGATLLTPNVGEAEVLSGSPASNARETGRDDERLHALATKILDETEAEEVVITCGEAGMVVLSKSAPALVRIPTFARDVYDVTGAGDTVVAVVALMKLLGLETARAMQIANAAAGIVVGRIGTSSVTQPELEQELVRLEKSGLIS